MAGLKDWLTKGDDEEFEEEVQTVRPRSSIYEQPITKDANEAVRKFGNSDSNLQIFEPRGYKDCYAIGVCLVQNKGVVVNLHRLTKDQAIRVYDFLCGVIYAIDGDLKKLGDTIFIFAPNNIGLDGSITFESDEMI